MDIYGNEAYNIRQVLKEQFTRQNDLLQEMLGMMKRPENPVVKFLQFVVLVVGATGILDVIRKIIDIIKGGL